MKLKHLGALIVATFFPAAVACANPVEKPAALGQETAQTPDEAQAGDTEESPIDPKTYDGQVRLISNIFEDLQSLVDANAKHLDLEKSVKLIEDVSQQMVSILKQLPEYHKIAQPTLKEIVRKQLQSSASMILIHVAELFGQLPKSEANTDLILAVKEKIQLLRDSL